jgi:hypothetical protein
MKRIDFGGVDVGRGRGTESQRGTPTALAVGGERLGRITELIEAKPWGVREFTILDPDNNELRSGQETG